jgi:hypothetical protein
MRKFIALFAAVLILGAGGVAMASETANQTVTYEIEAINELSVSGNPGALTVNAAVAGAAPTAVEDATSSYAITTNETDRKITGAIDTDMPAGVTLTANLAAPTGGTSANAVALTAVAADFVTGISTLNETAKSITYGLSATSAAGVVASATKTVTFTIAASI